MQSLLSILDRRPVCSILRLTNSFFRRVVIIGFKEIKQDSILVSSKGVNFWSSLMKIAKVTEN
jgi:hypothetical protein